MYGLSLWEYWDAIRCPVLVLRGRDSDLLPADTAQQMTTRGPRAELVEIAGCGHAPALMSDDQIELVTGWLSSSQVPAHD
jgi:pimeloyl-ACP methyl ester carboxylesterase